MRKIYLFLLSFFVIFVISCWIAPCKSQSQTFPPVNMIISDSAANAGYFFMSPYKNAPPYLYDRPLMITDQLGRLVFYRYFPGPMNENATIDFKLQPDGRMSYFNVSAGKFFLMDSTFSVVDSILCVNGFDTDQHDFQVFPNHHYMLMGLETRVMNLTAYHWFGPNHTTPGGANALVTAVVLQEFDANKQLVWEWKGHDHYAFGDVDQLWLSLPNKVDWTHANSVELDHDGNILLSLRHFDEITKINRSTGDIIWRFGGKANQFTFPNDTIGFTGQHDIRRVSDTSVSFLDNGQYTNPAIARAVEFALDENNKIARLVWQYFNDSSHVSAACGNHQYLQNGNHLIDWGFIGQPSPWLAIVKPDKSKVLDLYFDNGYISYRAFNYITLPWQLPRPSIDCEVIGGENYLVAEPGHAHYIWSTGDTTSSIIITQPGEYYVFATCGDGFMCSERLKITDPLNPCSYTPVPAPPVPAGYTLSCMPNPATNYTRIRFDLPADTDVSITLFSMTGEQLQNPVQSKYRAGHHEVPLDVSSLGKGVYFVSMTTVKTRIVTKIIIR